MTSLYYDETPQLSRQQREFKAFRDVSPSHAVTNDCDNTSNKMRLNLAKLVLLETNLLAELQANREQEITADCPKSDANTTTVIEIHAFNDKP